MTTIMDRDEKVYLFFEKLFFGFGFGMIPVAAVACIFDSWTWITIEICLAAASFVSFLIMGFIDPYEEGHP